MKPLTLSILAAVTLLAAMVVAGASWRGGQQPAQAGSSEVTTLAIDMDPRDGTSSFVNDDHTVGAIDSCIATTAGATVTFDVVLDAIPGGVGDSDLKGFQYFMGFDDTNLSFIAQSHTTAGVNILTRHPNSCSGLLDCVDTGEVVPEPPDSGSPASPGVHDVFLADTTQGSLVGSGTDPFGKAGGVLGRYELAVSSEAPSGFYFLGLNDSITYTANVSQNASNGSVAGKIWDLPGNDIDDDEDGAVDEDFMLDAGAGYGVVAVDVPCSEAPPAPTPTPSPSPAGSPTPTVSPTPAVSATPAPPPGPHQTDLVSGWNNVCYLGNAQPIEEALADIGEDVVAVYRLKAGQGYDRWFPERPDTSTITTLASYEPLLILMASGGPWLQQGQASPPMSASLSEGWSNVCYAGGTKDAASATAAIQGEFAVLYLLDSTQNWRRFVPARPEVSNLNQLVGLEPVLILVTQPGGGQWMFDP